MTLTDIIQHARINAVDPINTNVVIGSISCDSREKMPQGMFVALKGHQSNGELFIADAIKQGATVIVKSNVSRQLPQGGSIPDEVVVVSVDDPKVFLRDSVLYFYGYPTKAVEVVGVTGTNGKTTFTYLLESILQHDNRASAVIGTINYRIAGQVYPSKNTTPGLVDMQRYLAQLRDQAIPYALMEVSSHALHQGRLDGIDVKCAVFTNLTQDHLDYHGTMEAYFEAKALLFKNLKPTAHAVINSDDQYGQRLVALTQARVLTYGIDKPAMVQAVDIQYALSGTTFDLIYPSGRLTIKTRFIGKHNVYNLLAAAASALAQGISTQAIINGIAALKHVPGRLEPVDLGQPYFVFIDYAHTEDGLINVLKALRQVSQARIIVLFGCGGDRDKTKRPKMGQAVCQLADYAVVTSDNPRSEDPQQIINDICVGFTKPNMEICIDRHEAIGKVLAMAKAGEIILLAGKGHEDYQVLKNKTIPFNERSIIQEYLCLASKKS